MPSPLRTLVDTLNPPSSAWRVRAGRRQAIPDEVDIWFQCDERGRRRWGVLAFGLGQVNLGLSPYAARRGLSDLLDEALPDGSLMRFLLRSRPLSPSALDPWLASRATTGPALLQQLAERQAGHWLSLAGGRGGPREHDTFLLVCVPLVKGEEAIQYEQLLALRTTLQGCLERGEMRVAELAQDANDLDALQRRDFRHLFGGEEDPGMGGRGGAVELRMESLDWSRMAEGDLGLALQRAELGMSGEYWVSLTACRLGTKEAAACVSRARHGARGREVFDEKTTAAAALESAFYRGNGLYRTQLVLDCPGADMARATQEVEVLRSVLYRYGLATSPLPQRKPLISWSSSGRVLPLEHGLGLLPWVHGGAGAENRRSGVLVQNRAASLEGLDLSQGEMGNHAVIIGGAGRGKQFVGKALALDTLHQGGQVWVVAQHSDYSVWTQALGGKVIRLNRGPAGGLDFLSFVAARPDWKEALPLLRDWLSRLLIRREGGLAPGEQVKRGWPLEQALHEADPPSWETLHWSLRGRGEDLLAQRVAEVLAESVEWMDPTAFTVGPDVRLVVFMLPPAATPQESSHMTQTVLALSALHWHPWQGRPERKTLLLENGHLLQHGDAEWVQEMLRRYRHWNAGAVIPLRALDVAAPAYGTDEMMTLLQQLGGWRLYSAMGADEVDRLLAHAPYLKLFEEDLAALNSCFPFHAEFLVVGGGRAPRTVRFVVEEAYKGLLENSARHQACFHEAQQAGRPLLEALAAGGRGQTQSFSAPA